MVFRYFILLLSGLLFVACSSEQQRLVHDIKFVLKQDKQQLNCADLAVVGLTDFRFYVFQDEGEVQLLDFVSAGECRVWLKATGFRSSVQAQGDLSFSIGVPNYLNHQNPVKAQPPLNQSAMHWQWLSGYKFLRLEYEKDDQLNRFHFINVESDSLCMGDPNEPTCQKWNDALQNDVFKTGAILQ